MRARDILHNTILTASNWLRSLRRKGLDAIALPIHGAYPELPVQQDRLPFPLNLLPLFPSPASLVDVRNIVEMINQDRRVRTVVFRFGELQAGLSTLYSLRRLMLDLRAQGKRTVAWLPTADTGDYYLASACDEVLLPCSGHLSVLGLRVESVFLKDTLAIAGIEADFEAIAEYKVAPDMFRRSTMSDPHREMLDDLLDSLFDEVITTIAEARGLDTARVRDLVDAMPLSAAEAVDAGLVDAVLYEDELPAYISSNEDQSSQAVDEPETQAKPLKESPAPLKENLSPITWQQAARRLRRPIKWTTRQRIGVVSLEGMIVPGPSRRMPVPLPIPVPLPFVQVQAGAETIAQALRLAESDERIAAVIFHVETPGGSALAADLIWREVRRLRERKPVVVLMGRQAASGGYYVSAPANRIVARPSTLTGSIGIWGGKFALSGLYSKLAMGREAVQRGEMAGIYSETALFSDRERERIRRDLAESYVRFKSRVAEGRGLTDDQVEAAARGRLWTGSQAHEVGLVDELGSFDRAVAIAKELAGLDPQREYTVVRIHPPRHTRLPTPFPQAPEDDTEMGLGAMLSSLQSMSRERVWALAPWTVHVLT
jgi:protease-4